MTPDTLEVGSKARTVFMNAFCCLKRSFGTREGRIEWAGGILSLPFAVAAVLLGLQAAREADVFSLQGARYLSGCFFAVGMALGIYASAWAFVAGEPHTRLAAQSAVLDATACITLAITIEWYLRAGMPKGYLPMPFAVPAILWAAGALMLVVAARNRKRPRG